MRHLTYLLPALFFANAATAETRLQAGQDLFQTKCIDTLSNEAEFDETDLIPLTEEQVAQLNTNLNANYIAGSTFNHLTQPVVLSVVPKQLPESCGVTMLNQPYDDIIALWDEVSAGARHATKPTQFAFDGSRISMFRNRGQAVIHLRDKVFLQLFLSYGGTNDDQNLTFLHAIRIEASPFACEVFPEICNPR